MIIQSWSPVHFYGDPTEFVKNHFPNNKFFAMSFFQQIFDLSDGMDLTLHIKRKHGRLTIQVLPQTINKVDPAIVTGTPEELDAGFFDAVKAPVEAAKGLDIQVTSFNASVTKQKETVTKKESPNSDKKVKATSGKELKAQKTAAKKKDKEKMATAQSMFDAPGQEPPENDTPIS